MKWCVFFLILLMLAPVVPAVVSTEEIAAVRARAETASELSEQDKAGIDKFLLSALNGIFLAEKSEEMVKTRRQIVEQKGTKPLSLYTTAYLTVLRDRLGASVQVIGRIDEPARRQMVHRNLAILTAELQSVILVDFGVQWAQDPDPVVRYWAVKSIADTAIAQQLDSEVTANPEAAQKIFETLQTVIQNEPLQEVLALTAGFSAAWQDTRSAQLLERLTARRLEDYNQCREKTAWLDNRILRAMAEKYAAQKLAEEKTAAGRRFALLLSAVMQRWIQNEAAGGKGLSEEARSHLITTLVETEDRLLPKLEAPAPGIRRVLERGGGLQPVYEDLMGTTSRRGTLATRLGIDFGRDSEGRPLTIPPVLPVCSSVPPAVPAGQG